MYRLWETPSGDDDVKQFIFPKSLWQGVLQQLYDAHIAGHLGTAKTLGRVRQKFYWVQCRKDVQECVATVIFVHRREAPRRILKHLWENTMLDLPWSALQLMYWGHFLLQSQETSILSSLQTISPSGWKPW